MIALQTVIGEKWFFMLTNWVTPPVFKSDKRKIVVIHDPLGEKVPVFPASDVVILWQSNKSSKFVQFLVEIAKVVQWQNVAEV